MLGEGWEGPGLKYQLFEGDCGTASSAQTPPVLVQGCAFRYDIYAFVSNYCIEVSYGGKRVLAIGDAEPDRERFEENCSAGMTLC
jgi:hypothetical protein